MSRIVRSWSAALLMIAALGCGDSATEELSNDSLPNVSTRRPADAASDAASDASSGDAASDMQSPRTNPPAAGSSGEASSGLPDAAPTASARVPRARPNDAPVAQPNEPATNPVEPPVEPDGPAAQPVEAVEPGGPLVEPVEPAGPVAEPVESVESVESGESGESGGPAVEPVEPAGPAAEPVEPQPVVGGAPDCSVPAEAREEDVSRPDIVIGNGTPQSCTSDAFVEAVARGGVITFDCGPSPVVIRLDRTAKVFNDQNPDIVLDGGGKVTLSGAGRVRILYQNTCDPDQVWTTSHCDDQDHPRLTVQNLTFIDGNAQSEDEGGGAIFVRGGRFKAVNTQFFGNVCQNEGPDVGGGAIRVFDQYQDRPVYIVNSRFGAQGRGNVCSNGGALSSIGVSYTVLNSTFTDNQAIGFGANPQRSGTPGGGSGGAIYNDGNTFTLSVCGSYIANNTANEGGGAIFFVSNDLSGRLFIEDSVLEGNPSDGFETAGYPGIFVLANGEPQVNGSTLLP